MWRPIISTSYNIRDSVTSTYTGRKEIGFIMTQALDFLMTQDWNYLVTQDSIVSNYTGRIIPTTIYS